jgi:GNAT superfamily N-acetyltransferase
VDRPAEGRVTVRDRTPADQAAVAGLLAATADRVAALGPARLGRRPGAGAALVAIGADGTVCGHVRPVEHVLAEDDPERTYAPDRSVAWSDAAFAGPDPLAAVLAVAARVRRPGPARNSVAVTADARGRGLGRAVVAAALAAAGDGRAGSTLWFSPPNPIASRVWPHLGWRPIWSAWERRS